MKIAIFSPFCSQNYGTVLQAFALSNVLKKLGHECEYIDWTYYQLSFWHKVKFVLRHPFYLYYRNKNLKRNSKDLSYKFLSLDSYLEIIKKNQDFCNKYTPVSKKQYVLDELSKLENGYDKFIVGSDQTWSPDALYQYSPHYLPFIKDKSKKVSYGCSLGTLDIPKEFQKFLKKRLSSFDSLSCREHTNANLLTTILKKEVSSVLDPTLLINKESWRKYERKYEEISGEYILCYILGEKKCISDYAEKLGKEKCLPVYYIVTRPCYESKQNVLPGVGVAEFIWLIDNCKYLVTDSFHGTIFAINFERNFISFDKHKDNLGYDNGRLKEVLHEFNLLSHYHIDDDFSFPDEIDYSVVNKIHSYRIEFSLSYINSFLNK